MWIKIRGGDEDGEYLFISIPPSWISKMSKQKIRRVETRASSQLSTSRCHVLPLNGRGNLPSSTTQELVEEIRPHVIGLEYTTTPRVINKC